MCVLVCAVMAGKVGGALAAPVWERFWSKVEKTNFCWVWTGALNSSGYGVIWNGYERVYAHRLSWEFAGESISDTMTIDHLCRNRACVRPDHLELVTKVDNIRRGFKARLGPDWVPPADRPRIHAESDEAHRRRSEAAKRRWARQRGEAA